VAQPLLATSIDYVDVGTTTRPYTVGDITQIGLGLASIAAIGTAGRLGSAASGLGDLTVSEVRQIQSVVNQAGRPLEVVGSAARGARNAASDIDYIVPPSSSKYFEGLESRLPSLDPKHGIIPGVGNPHVGPVIRFEPQ
jgi:hypothetical protein